MAAFAAEARGGGARGWTGRIGAALVALATAFAILGLTMIPFFTPAWIHFEQGRAGSAAWTGYSTADVDRATDSLVHDLVLGGAFDVRVGADPVLDPAEASHLRDVRGVLDGFAIIVLVSLAGLAIVAWRSHGAAAGAATWAAVRRGAAWLAILLVVLGVFAVTAFDTAFTLFHQILFPGGNWEFDPRTQKLVQLFPEQFGSETVLTRGTVAIVVSVVVAWFAGRRARALEAGS